MTRQVLVTGGFGFLGRHVARRYAADGWQVRGIGHGSWLADDAWRWGVSEWHTADITRGSLEAFGGEPELIVHCAGGASVAASMDDPRRDFSRTVTLTIDTLEFARSRRRMPRFLFPSSGSVYGARAGTPGEDSPFGPPASPHAGHKQIAELLCRQYGALFSVPVAVIRFFSLCGPGLRKQLLWDACRRVRAGDKTFAGTGNEERDFLHVDDAVSLAMMAADRADLSCPVVNGGTGIATRVRDVIAEVAQRLGVDAGRLSFTGEIRAGDPFRLVADISLAHGWGWRPGIAWKDAVAAYCTWFSAEAR